MTTSTVCCLTGVLLASACGRVGFDPGATSSASDATRSDSAIDPIAPAYVQKKEVSPGAVRAATVTLGAETTAGNLIILAIDVAAPLPSLDSVTDTIGSVYSIVEPPAPGWRTFFAYAIAGSTGTATITATMSATPNSFFNVRAFEYTNVAQTNATSPVASSTGTMLGIDAAQTTIVTTEPNQLIVGFATFRSAAGDPGTGYSVRSTFDGDIVEDRVVATPGQYAVLASPRPAVIAWAVAALAIRGR